MMNNGSTDRLYGNNALNDFDVIGLSNHRDGAADAKRADQRERVAEAVCAAPKCVRGAEHAGPNQRDRRGQAYELRQRVPVRADEGNHA